MRFVILLAGLLAFIALDSSASPAYPGRVPVVLPSGDTVYVHVRGDEYLKWAETEDGYTLLRDSSGEWTYAVPSPSTGKAMPSEWKLQGKNPENAVAFSEFLRDLPRKVPVDTENALIMRKAASTSRAVERSASSVSVVGQRKVLVILMSFQDWAFSKSMSEFDALFNAEGYADDGAVGSVRDYFSTVSYGQLLLESDLFGPYQASYPMSYYGGNNIYGNDSNPTSLFVEAIQAVAEEVDLAEYDGDGDGYVDNVHIIFAGYGEEAGASADAIWSHEATFYGDYIVQGMKIRSYSCAPELRGNSGEGISRIGPHCHEIGHALGAMDYYDTDYSGSGGYFPGTGMWDIMASGSWNEDGVVPADFNPYVKAYDFGWVEPQDLPAGEGILLYPSCFSPDSYYRVDTPEEGDYYLLENRSREGFGAGLPGEGLLVFHVHPDIESAVGTNTINASYPQMCYPVCAASTYRIPTSAPASYGEVDGAGCPFPGSSGQTDFSFSTSPAAFCWDSGGDAGFELSSITQLADGTISLTCAYGATSSDDEGEEGGLLYSEGFEQSQDWDIESAQGVGWQLCGGVVTDGSVAIANELDVPAAEGENYLALKNRSLGLFQELQSVWYLPQLRITPDCPYVLRFAYQNRSYLTVGGGRLEVLLRTSKEETWDTLAVYADLTTSWVEKSVEIPASDADSLQIAFRGNLSVGGLFLDDVRIYTGVLAAIQTPTVCSGIWSERNCLVVETETDEKVFVYSCNGILLHVWDAVAGINRYSLESGMYVVVTSGVSRKIIITD